MSLVQYVPFTLDERRFALPLETVERVLPVIEITLLPKAPRIIDGVVEFDGRVIPVVNTRRRFSLAEKETSLADRIIIARTSRRTVALIADSVSEVGGCEGADLVTPSDISPGLEYVKGVARLADGILIINDLDSFLSLDEEAALDKALKDAGSTHD